MSHQIPALLGAAIVVFNLFAIIAIAGLWIRLKDSEMKYKLAKLSWIKVRDSSTRLFKFLDDVIEGEAATGEDYESFIIGSISALVLKAQELGRVKEVLEKENQSSSRTSDAVMSLCIADRMLCENWAIPLEIQPRSRAMLLAFFKKVALKYLQAQKNRMSRHEDPEGWLQLGKSWPVAECQQSVILHIAKGDPVDVAIYCAFLSWHEEETSLMNYISVTPALEALIQGVVRNIPEGTDLSTIAPVESKMEPEFKLEHVEGPLRIKTNPVPAQKNLDEECGTCGQRRGSHSARDESCPRKDAPGFTSDHFTKDLPF